MRLLRFILPLNCLGPDNSKQHCRGTNEAQQKRLTLQILSGSLVRLRIPILTVRDSLFGVAWRFRTGRRLAFPRAVSLNSPHRSPALRSRRKVMAINPDKLNEFLG